MVAQSGGVRNLSNPDEQFAGVERALAQAIEQFEQPEVLQLIAAEHPRHIEERFAQIVESLPSSVWITRERRILYANVAAAELLSTERERLIGTDLAALFVEEDVSDLIANFKHLERGRSVPPQEYRLKIRDGVAQTLEMSFSTLAHEGGGIVLSLGRDITLRKRAEQGLLQADRLSALGLLAGGMAHALNNPLTYVVLNLDHVERALPALEGESGRIAEVMTRLGEAREGAERMAHVVRRVRGFARSDDSARRALDLRAVLESVVDLVGHELYHRGKLSARFEDVPRIVANESKLEHICLGLLLFASQLVPDDPREWHEVRLSLYAEEPRNAVLEIVCEGSAIDSFEAERLVEPYVNSGEGTAEGFGISVCRALVEELGGQIVASCLRGIGLVLRTTIPGAEEHTSTDGATSAPPSRPVPALRAEKARVLLIDDDPGVALALRVMLETEHEVTSMVDPQEALKELLRDPNYDLVFCDLMMPKLSGMDLFRVLRFNRPGYESRIVFTTGGASTLAAQRFLAQVPNPRLDKPFNLSDLSLLLKRAVLRRS